MEHPSHATSLRNSGEAMPASEWSVSSRVGLRRSVFIPLTTSAISIKKLLPLTRETY